MNRVLNADQFLLDFRRICGKYEQVFGPRLAGVRTRYAGTPEEDALDQTLEAHARAYIVDDLLAALNWRLDTPPEDRMWNLIPEAPVRSEERGSIRFLDYLGLERETDAPLLIVETKRPSVRLPEAWSPAATYSEIVARGLAGKPLKGDWNEWLQDLRDYVHSVYARTQKVPKRVVITNGDWLIVFLDPTDAFLEGGNRDPNLILVFENRRDIERRSIELFSKLEYHRVLGETPPLTPGELLFYLRPGDVDRAMHGLHLRYIEEQTVHQARPVITVAPALFLGSRYGAWLCVDAPPKEYELPHRKDDLVRHLEEVQQAADQLLSEVSQRLGGSLRILSLSEHYDDEVSALPGVRQYGRDEFLVVTGDETHYLLSEPTVPDCPYHDWGTCKRVGVPSGPGPVVVRSISPRSFFVSGEPHHCAHRDVSSAKASQISSSNRDRCGPRRGQEGQAFCEIWQFEQYLCCRACAFEKVCAKAPVFQLPC